MSRSIGSHFRRTVRFIIIAGAISCLVFFYFWETGALPTYLEREIVQSYIRKIQPHLPFIIERFEVTENWREFLQFRLHSLHLVLKWGPEEISLSGPVEIYRIHGNFDFRFHPKAIIDHSDPVDLDIQTITSDTFTKLNGISLHLKADHWKWQEKGLAVEHGEVDAQWERAGADSNPAHARVDLVGAAYNSVAGSPPYSANLAAIHLDAVAPLEFGPLRVGPELQAKWNGKRLEILAGDNYLALPLEKIPGSLVATFEESAQRPPELKRASMVLDALGKSRSVELVADHEGDTLRANWKIRSLPIAQILSTLSDATSSSENAPSSAFQIYRGEMDSSGELSSRLPFRVKDLIDGEDPLRGQLVVRDFTGTDPTRGVAIQNAAMTLSLSNRTGVEGMLSAAGLYFRKLKATLEPTEIRLSRDHVTPTRVNVLIGKRVTIPLKVAGFPVQIGSIHGTVDYKSPIDFHLHTSVLLPPTPLTALISQTCLIHGEAIEHIPPASLSIDFSDMTVSPGSFDPTGIVKLALFDGYIQASEIGFFDVFSGLPETDFNLESDGIRLDELSQWAGIGDIDGFLSISAKDVTLQGPLATGYHLILKGKPHNKKNRLEFSPEAMRNFIHVVAGQDVFQYVPGIAQWAFFGFPSHLIGGFDVKYVGIDLLSSEGTTILKTLDDEEVLREDGEIGKHYILYGGRVRIPVQSSHYPVVLDETGLALVGHRILSTVHKLMDEKHEKDKLLKGENLNAPENEPELEKSCEPPDLSHLGAHDPPGNTSRVRDSERELSRKRGSEGV